MNHTAILRKTKGVCWGRGKQNYAFSEKFFSWDALLPVCFGKLYWLLNKLKLRKSLSQNLRENVAEQCLLSSSYIFLHHLQLKIFGEGFVLWLAQLPPTNKTKNHYVQSRARILSYFSLTGLWQVSGQVIFVTQSCICSAEAHRWLVINSLRSSLAVRMTHPPHLYILTRPNMLCSDQVWKRTSSSVSSCCILISHLECGDNSTTCLKVCCTCHRLVWQFEWMLSYFQRVAEVIWGS